MYYAWTHHKCTKWHYQIYDECLSSPLSQKPLLLFIFSLSSPIPYSNSSLLGYSNIFAYLYSCLCYYSLFSPLTLWSLKDIKALLFSYLADQSRKKKQEEIGKYQWTFQCLNNKNRNSDVSSEVTFLIYTDKRKTWLGKAW